MLLQQSVESYSFFTWNLLCLHLSLQYSHICAHTHTHPFSIVTPMLKYLLVGIFLSWGLEFFSPTFVYLRGYSAHDNDRWPPTNVTSRRYIHRLLPVVHQWQILSEGCSVLFFILFYFFLGVGLSFWTIPKMTKTLNWLIVVLFLGGDGDRKNPPKK